MGARLVIMEHIVLKPVGIQTLVSNVRRCVIVPAIVVTILQDVKVRFNMCYLMTCMSKKRDFYMVILMNKYYIDHLKMLQGLTFLYSPNIHSTKFLSVHPEKQNTLKITK